MNWIKSNLRWIKDAVERVLATYLMSFVGFLALDGVNQLNADVLKSAAMAALPAALSAVKAILARKVGNPDDASLVSL